MRILKFGGKSLDSAEKTQKICKYIKKIYEKDKKLIIVVSAIGNTTDKLLELAKAYDAENLSKRELDVLLSSGETISASLFAITLNSMGVPAKSFQAWQIKINTMGEHQNNLITHIDKSQIENTLSENTVVVVTGFQGINKNGDISTLGRGGSDTTAVALGATFQTKVELYSDFNGIFGADPREIKTKKIRKISFNQLDFLSQNGSRVISNRAVKIAKEQNISLVFKSSANPCREGTISDFLEHNSISISSNQNLCELFITCADEKKLKLLSKNVILWLNGYKLHNFTLKSQNIALLINQSDKAEILKLLSEKLKL